MAIFDPHKQGFGKKGKYPQKRVLVKKGKIKAPPLKWRVKELKRSSKGD